MRIDPGCFYKYQDQYVTANLAGAGKLELVNLGGTTLLTFPATEEVHHNILQVGMTEFFKAKHRHDNPEKYDADGNLKPEPATGVVEVAKSKKKDG